ncbi:M48 family metallopeptidase [Roseovarius sp. SCSIO 43702]|uniref:M48 family metallopeptidase n=1 Tax=Roseovarius sp. SCSIO 43702 TaxID=2823043 RepID=UPI001C73668F|nr:M48 family metallopeptidase [Roseovarius sp. SCSIO 43702]QYX57813.1 M48 family metallopeptidase [Roseovarius sp. SCSIO 43702]
MRILSSFVLLVFLAACGAPPPSQPTSQPTGQTQTRPQAQRPTTPSAAQVARFRNVVARVEPVAERQCRAQSQGLNCDFKVVIDDRPQKSPNAFQTVDRSGRPIIAFNLPLIAAVRNEDELAFVMGHEAAHHIERHLDQQRNNAMAGAIILGGLAALTGASSTGVDAAADLGANVGARSYSKAHELEADALGTVITRRAGYNPVRGAEFFTQIADPGDRFLGTHPPNKDRIATVKRVDASIR